MLLYKHGKGSFMQERPFLRKKEQDFMNALTLEGCAN